MARTGSLVRNGSLFLALVLSPLSPAAVAVAADVAPGAVALDAELYLGAAIEAEAVVAWPVYSRTPAAEIAGDLVPLAEAQRRGQAAVRERSGGGTVNQLLIENRGSRPILVLAGTLLKGGNQDRQVGQDFIVPPHKRVPVDAFCVEHGRWTAARDGVATAGKFEAQPALAPKAVRKKAQFDADQSGVWQEVAAINGEAGKRTETGTLFATIENGDARAAGLRQRIAERLGAALKAGRRGAARPIGIAYAVAGKPREVRVFTHPRVFERFEATLLRTIAIEGELAARSPYQAPPAIAAQAEAVAQLVHEGSAGPAARSTTSAGNVNAVRKGKDVNAADCFADERAPRPATRTFQYAH